MARVPRRGTSAAPISPRSRLAKSRIRKHKIVLESVTQEKKKLRSVISFQAEAPPGYTFIPAGNPQLTNACKERCRKEGRKVFAVTTTPHQNTHDLSQQVHRIGYHFPSLVVAAVCSDLQIILSATGRVRSIQGYGIDEAPRASAATTKQPEKSQIVINTEARDAIKDLFPNIPETDLSQIISTAFKKGQRKVGTAEELPLARRVQLAVVAHIRHTYTNYDRLLRLGSFQEARSTVEQPTLAKLVEWRGDDENGKTVLEDVFREVIVISDEEDSDDDESVDQNIGLRDNSVEIVSSDQFTHEVQTKTRPVNYADPGTFERDEARYLGGDEAPSGFRFVARVPRKKGSNRQKIDRRGFSRYEAWDRAKDLYSKQLAPGAASAHNRQESDIHPVTLRGGEADFPLPVAKRALAEPGGLYRAPRLGTPGQFQNALPPAAHPSPNDIHLPTQQSPEILRLEDGSLFRRALPHLYRRASEHHQPIAHYSNSSPLLNGQVRTSHHPGNLVHRRPISPPTEKWQEHTILPSIEDQPILAQQPAAEAIQWGAPQSSRKRTSDDFQFLAPPREIPNSIKGHNDVIAPIGSGSRVDKRRRTLYNSVQFDPSAPSSRRDEGRFPASSRRTPVNSTNDREIISLISPPSHRSYATSERVVVHPGSPVLRVVPRSNPVNSQPSHPRFLPSDQSELGLLRDPHTFAHRPLDSHDSHIERYIQNPRPRGNASVSADDCDTRVSRAPVNLGPNQIAPAGAAYRTLLRPGADPDSIFARDHLGLDARRCMSLKENESPTRKGHIQGHTGNRTDVSDQAKEFPKQTARGGQRNPFANATEVRSLHQPLSYLDESGSRRQQAFVNYQEIHRQPVSPRTPKGYHEIPFEREPYHKVTLPFRDALNDSEHNIYRRLPAQSDIGERQYSTVSTGRHVQITPNDRERAYVTEDRRWPSEMNEFRFHPPRNP